MNNIIGVRSQESGVRPVVSFCIPVYNNAEAALKIVNDLLVSDDARFEVVVSDDCSTDNAKELLSQVKDPRFRYFRNEKNLGAHKNWEHSLELGQGEYLYLIMGRDKMHGENIPNLIQLLEYCRDNNVTYLKDRGRPKKSPRKIYSGIDALAAFVDYNHPTGTIFYRNYFMEIPNRGHYFEIADMYPEAYVAKELLMKGKGAFISSGLSYGGFVIDKKKIKSTVEHDVNLFETYFAPKRRTLQFYELIDMIDPALSGIFTPKELNMYFGVKFYSLLKNVSYEWYSWLRDPEQMAHYGQKVHCVTVREMVQNIRKAYSDTKAHLKENGTYTAMKDRTMHLRMLEAYFVLIPHAIVKYHAKRLLKPLGLWEVLKFVKSKLKPSRLP
ncbi:MAG: glycosyltransferase family 2 protein [Synergistaceae bacterium]|nr:glycosyltransferase family 2 protein [Synergistaceae bacterium]